MDAFSDNQLDRYARHLILPQVGGVGQRRLIAARIVVVGAGGIAAGALPYLAAAGVGRIRLIDDDTVSRTNLQRQTLYAAVDIGAAKVERAARALSRINPDCAIEPAGVRLTVANAAELLAGADVVLDGCDNFATRLIVGDTAVALGIPLVSAAVGPFDGQLSTFRGHDPALPCYRCLVGAAPVSVERSCADTGVLGALTGAMGGLAAIEVLREIVAMEGGLAGRLTILDALTNRQRSIILPKDPACPTCSSVNPSGR